jgi:hypothetical protein
MSNYDKIFEVLKKWYSVEQIDKIWEMLKDFDSKLTIRRKQWIAFLEVRQDGQYNMMSPMARQLAGIDKPTWKQILSNFDDLYDKWGDLNECV